MASLTISSNSEQGHSSSSVSLQPDPNLAANHSITTDSISLSLGELGGIAIDRLDGSLYLNNHEALPGTGYPVDYTYSAPWMRPNSGSSHELEIGSLFGDSSMKF